ncbi:MAG: aspartate carbamoyltransferase [Candidatus Poribacteria bacterium]|nr:aspartate carbamoyltransferase [Candidatus Poribacteria bacterium]
MRHLIRIDELIRDEMTRLFDLAADMETLREMGSDLCKGRILFYEPSPRTRLSFESAMIRLGGSVLGFSDPQSTSFVKHETLADTVHMVCNYADIIVIRHPHAGAAQLAAQHSPVPVVNAGDDSHQHPTQTLTDLYTLRKTRGDISSLTVGVCGDLRYGRAAHSLAYGLATFGAKIVLIAPDGLTMPDEIVWRLNHLYGATVETVASPMDAIAELDVLYVNRLQKERLPQELDPAAVVEIAKQYRIDAETMRHARPDCLIMHPLPRVDEIARELDDDPRAIFFEQSSNGVPVRMALMAMLLNRVDRPPLTEKSPDLTTHADPICHNPVCITQHEPRVAPLSHRVAPDHQVCLYCQLPY